MKILTDYSEIMIMALEENNVQYEASDVAIKFELSDQMDIPREISNALQLIDYQIV